MTNPDNVGWLPEFVAVGEFVGYGRVTGEPHVRMSSGLRPGVRLFTEDQMRAYGELCRAAPAGGDSWPLEVGDALLKWNRSHPAGPLISIGYEYGVAAKVAEIMRDSAPAGSGEVTDEMVEAYKDVLASLVAAVALLERGGKKAAPADLMFEQMLADYRKSIESGRAALLRKLQQGADYVMVPRDSAKMVTHVCSEWIDLFRDAPGIEKYERYSYEPAVEELRDEYAAIAASQDQDGGHASVD